MTTKIDEGVHTINLTPNITILNVQVNGKHIGRILIRDMKLSLSER